MNTIKQDPFLFNHLPQIIAGLLILGIGYAAIPNPDYGQMQWTSYGLLLIMQFIAILLATKRYPKLAWLWVILSYLGAISAVFSYHPHDFYLFSGLIFNLFLYPQSLQGLTIAIFAITAGRFWQQRSQDKSIRISIFKKENWLTIFSLILLLIPTALLFLLSILNYLYDLKVISAPWYMISNYPEQSSLLPDLWWVTAVALIPFGLIFFSGDTLWRKIAIKKSQVNTTAPGINMIMAGLICSLVTFILMILIFILRQIFDLIIPETSYFSYIYIFVYPIMFFLGPILIIIGFLYSRLVNRASPAKV
jgi:hypothetical protein